MVGSLLLGLLSTGAITAAPASAAAPGNCYPTSYTMCFFEHSNFRGAVGSVLLNSGQTSFNITTLNDSISSLVNNDSSPWCFFRDANLSGQGFDVSPHEAWSQVPAGVNDRISSARRGRC